ncbi:MAG: hypothetical protein LBS30_02790 [Planctomycetota bacterium]|jgi:MraZ protein|nr:hypothetical protein [Planctomycetota bacterium]
MSDTTPFYYGSAENKLNAKGQVAIPARFRSALSDLDLKSNFVLIRGEPQCLYMYTHSQFGAIKDNARRVALESGDADFYRSFMAEAHAVELDTQGRFVLPQALMKAVGMKGPGVLFIGVDDRIEIWEPGVYDAARGEKARFEELRRSAARSIFGM